VEGEFRRVRADAAAKSRLCVNSVSQAVLD
jgi:hypothetical protein